MKKCVINADDFGKSDSVNACVERAFREGILSSASIMAGGESFSGACNIIKENSELGIGIHITLLHGKSVLKHKDIPDLVDGKGYFCENPFFAGINLFFRKGIANQIRCEIKAQIETALEAGISLGHLDGHLNIHLHPSVLWHAVDLCREYDIPYIRITREPLFMNLFVSGKNLMYKISHKIIFDVLAYRAKPLLRENGIGHIPLVIGLLESGNITSSYLMKTLPRVDAEIFEIYCHPEQNNCDFKTLIDANMKKCFEENAIRIITYREIKEQE
ncbi:MAG: ChbG/HpnK family deacetylase [Candidatus Kuenenia sp.]|nr:ChbG/HpnK family deacetylase [Candidatus Kuenenia hertensis]